MAKEYLLSSVHVHTKLCDGKNTLEELALSAWKAGLKTLGFSGHSHTPHDIEYCMTNARTQLYRAQVAKLKERYAGKLDILCGLEWDLYSDDDPAAYDYWIGSAHYVKGPKTGKYYEIDWREADLAACIQDDFDGDGLAVVETYFANVAAVAAKKPTILGHFDLIKKVNGSGKFFDESDPRYTAAAEQSHRPAPDAGTMCAVLPAVCRHLPARRNAPHSGAGHEHPVGELLPKNRNAVFCPAAVCDAAARAGVCGDTRVLPLCPPQPQPGFLGRRGQGDAGL